MKNKKTQHKRRLLPVFIALGLFALIGGVFAVSQDRSIIESLFHLKYGETQTYDVIPPSDWKRCDEAPKEVVTTNSSTFNIRVRLSYDEYWLAQDNTTYLPVAPGGDRLTTINLQNQNDWEDGNDGWIYWKGTLAPGESNRSLLKSVTYNCDSSTAVETICTNTPTGTVCEQPEDPYEDASYHVFVTVQTTEENGEFPGETTYNVSIDPNGGTYNDSSEIYTAQVRRGTTIDLSNVSYTNHELIDWTLNGDTSYTSSVIVANEDIALVANWDSGITYNVTVDPNGGTYDGSASPSTYTIGDGQTFTALEATREGYAFNGWELTDGTPTEGTFVVTEDKEIRATWAPAVARIERTGTLYPSITAADLAAEAGDTITLLVNTTEAATTTKTVILNLNEHTVTGSITNSGNLTLINGEVNNPNGAAVTNNGTLTMGVNDYKQDGSANIIDDYIRLIGTSVGLQQNATFNFYDGYIEGDVALSGGYDSAPFYHNVEQSEYIYYYPFISHNEIRDCQHAELESADNSVTKTIVGGDIYYLNLQDNINTSTITGYEIYAVRNFSATYPVTVDTGAEIEFDVAGFEVNMADTLTNNGKLTVTNSGTTGKIVASQTAVNNGEMIVQNAEISGSTTNDTIANNGTIRLRSGTLSASDGYVMHIVSGTTLDMDNDSYISTTSASRAAIYNGTNDFVINGGNINSPYIGVEGGNYSQLTMTGGKISVKRDDYYQNGYGIYCYTGCDTTLSGNATIEVGRITENGNPNDIRGIYTYNGNSSLVMEDDAAVIADYAPSVVAISGIDTITLRDNALVRAAGTNATAISGGGTSLVIEDNSNVAITASGIWGATGITNSNATINSGSITATTNCSYSSTGATAFDFGSGSLVLNNGTITATDTNAGFAVGLAGGSGYYVLGTADIRGGTVTATSNSGLSYGVNGGTGGGFTMSGGAITSTSTSSTSYGTYFKNNTNTITGGTVSGGTYGINTDNNTVTIGIDDGTTPSITSPEIIGGSYGLYNGSYSFYDGILKGGDCSYKDGAITAIPDATIVHTETIDGVQNSWLTEAANYLEVNDVQYNSLTKAYNAITGNSGTVKVIADTRVEAALPTSPADKEITFDLNGHNLVYTQTLTVGGTMNIVDNSTNHDGVLSNPNTYTITNNSTLNIQSGTVSSSNRTIKNNTDSTVTISGGTISASNIGIENYHNNTVTMTGGTIDVSSENGTPMYGIYCTYLCNTNLSGDSTINVGRKTPTGTTDQVYGIYEYNYNGMIVMEDNASININATNTGVGFNGPAITLRDNATVDVYCTNGAYGGYSASTSTIEPGSNVTINATSESGSAIGVYVYGGSTFTMNSGTVTANGVGGQWGLTSGITGDGIFELVDGTVTATNVATNSTTYGINNLTTNISGGSVSASSYYVGYGYYGGNSTAFTMSGGNISANSENNDSYGAYFRTNSNTITGGTIAGGTYGISTENNNSVTLGDNDGAAPSITSPEIIGGTKATNTGSYYFYDGILKGGPDAAYSPGTITAIPDATIYHTEVVGGNKHCWLIDADNYLEVAGVEYNSLKKAYDAITGDTGTIKLIASTRVEATLPASPVNKSIVFDLNGNNLIYTQTMTVGGTLTIKDGSASQTGSLSNPNTYVITNDGTLNIESGLISSSDKTIKSNTGKTINISGGTISGQAIGIETVSDNIITMTGGTINVKRNSGGGTGVYCYSNCAITMSNNSAINVGRMSTPEGYVQDSFSAIYSYYAGGSLIMEDNASINTGYSWQSTGVSHISTITLRDNASIITNGDSATGITNAGAALTIEANSNVNITANGTYYATGINTSAVMMYSGTVNVSTAATSTSWGAVGIDIHDGSLTLVDGTINASDSDIGYVKGLAGSSSYSGRATISGGSISATSNAGTAHGFLAEIGDYYTITGGTIRGISTNGGIGYGGHFNNGWATVAITGGTIEGSTYGLSTETRAIPLGDNDGTTPSTTSPVIIGGTYALQTGPFKFYDGILKGGQDYFESADIISEIATDSALAFGTDVIDGSTYQTCYLVPEFDVAQIGDTKFTKLSDAITAANTGDTIKLIATNYIFTDLTIASGKDFTIDMNGYNIVSGHPITNNGKVRLMNSSTTSHPVLTYRKTNGYFITSTGTLELGQVQINAPKIISSSGSLALIESQLTSSDTAILNSGTTTFSDTIIDSQNIAINNTGTISNSTSDSSSISGANYGIYNNGGSATIDSAQLAGDNAYYQLDANATGALSSVNVTGSIISQAGTTSIIDSIVTKTGERVVGNIIGNNGDGTMTVNNVDINYTTVSISSFYNTPVIMLYNNGTMTATDVDVTLDISGSIYSSDTYGIKNDGARFDANDVNITYNNHNIVADSSSTAYGAQNSSGTLNFESGNITLTGRITSYGIYNGSGETTIGVAEDPSSIYHGTADADVSTTNPSIYVVGSTTGYGVKNESGRVNFYDGKITGSTHPMPDMPAIPTKTEYHFEVRTYTDADNYQYIILQYIQS